MRPGERHMQRQTKRHGKTQTTTEEERSDDPRAEENK